MQITFLIIISLKIMSSLKITHRWQSHFSKSYVLSLKFNPVPMLFQQKALTPRSNPRCDRDGSVRFKFGQDLVSDPGYIVLTLAAVYSSKDKARIN